MKTQFVILFALALVSLISGFTPERQRMKVLRQTSTVSELPAIEAIEKIDFDLMREEISESFFYIFL